MSVRQVIEAGLIVAALLLGWGMYNEWKGRIQAEALAAEAIERAVQDSVQNVALTDSLRRADSLAVSWEAEATEARRALREERTEAELDEGQASDDVVSAGDSLSATLDSVEVVAPDLGRTAHVQLDTLQASHNRVVDAFQRQLRAQVDITAVADSSLALCRTARGACDDLVSGLRREIATKDEVIAHQQDALNPGFFAFLSQNIPQMVGAVGVGFALGKVF